MPTYPDLAVCISTCDRFLDFHCRFRYSMLTCRSQAWFNVSQGSRFRLRSRSCTTSRSCPQKAAQIVAFWSLGASIPGAYRGSMMLHLHALLQPSTASLAGTDAYPLPQHDSASCGLEGFPKISALPSCRGDAAKTSPQQRQGHCAPSVFQPRSAYPKATATECREAEVGGWTKQGG